MCARMNKGMDQFMMFEYSNFATLVVRIDHKCDPPIEKVFINDVGLDLLQFQRDEYMAQRWGKRLEKNQRDRIAGILVGLRPGEQAEKEIAVFRKDKKLVRCYNYARKLLLGGSEFVLIETLPLPGDEKIQQKSVGLFESQWFELQKLARYGSRDALLRRAVAEYLETKREDTPVAQ